jgi:hypothetical protein
MMQSSRLVCSMVWLATTGCAGVYAEVSGSYLASAANDLGEGSSPVVAADSISSGYTIGFSLGVDFGSLRQRFAVGYGQDAASFDNDGAIELGMTEMRYDINLLSVSDRTKVRLGLGVGFGSGEATLAATGGGTLSEDGSGLSAFAGLGATHFFTWHQAVHLLAGARFLSADAPGGGSMTASGATVRLTYTYQLGDVRPDQEFVVPLEDATDLMPAMGEGARAMGCQATDSSHATYAVMNARCPGDRNISYVQIAEGMLVTCENTESLARCQGLAREIIDSALARR